MGILIQTTLNEAMPAVRDNIEQRVNGGLGVSEPNIRIITTNGQPAISVELPGLAGNQTEEVNSLLKTGNLEFWSTGPSPAAIGSHLILRNTPNIIQAASPNLPAPTSIWPGVCQPGSGREDLKSASRCKGCHKSFWERLQAKMFRPSCT